MIVDGIEVTPEQNAKIMLLELRIWRCTVIEPKGALVVCMRRNGELDPLVGGPNGLMPFDTVDDAIAAVINPQKYGCRWSSESIGRYPWQSSE